MKLTREVITTLGMLRDVITEFDDAGIAIDFHIHQDSAGEAITGNSSAVFSKNFEVQISPVNEQTIMMMCRSARDFLTSVDLPY